MNDNQLEKWNNILEFNYIQEDRKVGVFVDLLDKQS
jgi:hypothetical protein